MRETNWSRLSGSEPKPLNWKSSWRWVAAWTTSLASRQATVRFTGSAGPLMARIIPLGLVVTPVETAGGGATWSFIKNSPCLPSPWELKCAALLVVSQNRGPQSGARVFFCHDDPRLPHLCQRRPSAARSRSRADRARPWGGAVRPGMEERAGGVGAPDLHRERGERRVVADDRASERQPRALRRGGARCISRARRGRRGRAPLPPRGQHAGHRTRAPRPARLRALRGEEGEAQAEDGDLRAEGRDRNPRSRRRLVRAPERRLDVP